MQFTLRMIRDASGYTQEEVALYCGLKEDNYRELENDFSKAPTRVAYAVRSLLKISLDSIA